jgi:hypothetical protein
MSGFDDRVLDAAKPFSADEFAAWQARWKVKEKTAISCPAE